MNFGHFHFIALTQPSLPAVESFLLSNKKNCVLLRTITVACINMWKKLFTRACVIYQCLDHWRKWGLSLYPLTVIIPQGRVDPMSSCSTHGRKLKVPVYRSSAGNIHCCECMHATAMTCQAKRFAALFSRLPCLCSFQPLFHDASSASDIMVLIALCRTKHSRVI